MVRMRLKSHSIEASSGNTWRLHIRIPVVLKWSEHRVSVPSLIIVATFSRVQVVKGQDKHDPTTERRPRSEILTLIVEFQLYPRLVLSTSVAHQGTGTGVNISIAYRPERHVSTTAEVA